MRINTHIYLITVQLKRAYSYIKSYKLNYNLDEHKYVHKHIISYYNSVCYCQSLYILAKVFVALEPDVDVGLQYMSRNTQVFINIYGDNYILCTQKLIQFTSYLFRSQIR